MKFNINQQDLQQALNYCQGIIEKRSTLPILSNILLDVQNTKLTITATDLDLIFIHQIENIEVLEEGKTTTVSSTIHDIVRKLFSKLFEISVLLNNSEILSLGLIFLLANISLKIYGIPSVRGLSMLSDSLNLKVFCDSFS